MFINKLLGKLKTFNKKFTSIEVITVAKVGSTIFLHSLKNKYNVYHGHSLKKLKNVLEKKSNTLIIVGVRNPLARNISYLFQTFSDDFYNDVKTNKNNYEGEYCFIANKNELLNFDSDQIISEFYKKRLSFFI